MGTLSTPVVLPSNIETASANELRSQLRRLIDYTVIIAIFCSVLLIANLCATKPITFTNVPIVGHINTDGGGLIFPITYIFGDILTEVYGFRYARRAIWLAFGIMALATACFYVVGLAPGAPGWNAQGSYDNILGFFPRIVIASLLAFLTGEFMNSVVLAKMKVWTSGRQMWSRLVGSTIVGESLDTTIFGLVAFSAFFHGWDMVSFILAGVIFKCCYEFAALPLTYAVIRFLKRRAGVEVFDRKTFFNPFRFSLQK